MKNVKKCMCCGETEYLSCGFRYEEGRILVDYLKDQGDGDIKTYKDYSSLEEFLIDFPWVKKLAIEGLGRRYKYDFCEKCLHNLLIQKKLIGIFCITTSLVFPLYSDCCDRLFMEDSNDLYIINKRECFPYVSNYYIIPLLNVEKCFTVDTYPYQIKTNVICHDCIIKNRERLVTPLRIDITHPLFNSSHEHMRFMFKLGKELGQYFVEKRLYNLAIKGIELLFPFLYKDLKILIAKKCMK